VYGRPFTLELGAQPDAGEVVEHLRRLGYRSAGTSRVEPGEYRIGRGRWIIGRRAFRPAAALADGGTLSVDLDYQGRVSRLESADGTRLSRAVLEPELLGRAGLGALEDRRPIPLAEVPASLVQAVLTMEDQRFREHHGMDPKRIGAAAVANLRAGRVVQGGSTLTQQLAKNLFLSPKRSYVRKLREAFMAVALEARYSKDEILEAYLNEIYLGRDGATAIHGVGAAARAYFGKDISELDVAESALLAGIIRAPNAYTPLRHPDLARERRDLVLRQMHDAGVLDDRQADEASRRPIRVRRPPTPIGGVRYFTDWVARTAAVGPGGTVITTLSPRLQDAAQQAVTQGIARLERDFDWLREGEAGEPLQAALVALDPRNGEVLAMVGGRDHGRSQFNRATDARRQPGSAFKPVVALSALARPLDRDGQPSFTLASMLPDEPLRLETPAGVWEPTNYSHRHEGPVTLREALERSLNVPFARLGLEVGGERIVQTARRLGVESPLSPYPALALGASEVTPLELTRAFAVLAAGGARAPLRYALLSVDRDGQPTQPDVEPTVRVYDPSETYLVTSALLGVVERGTGRTLRDRGFQGQVAAKSGTTNDFRDAWFVGYTPTLAVGVWVGFDRGRSLQIPGAGAALPIFAAFLREAIGPFGTEGAWGSDGFDVPDGLERARVGPVSGFRGGWECWGEAEWFLSGTAPEGSCRDGRRWTRSADRDELDRLLERGGPDVLRLLREALSRVWRESRNGSGGR
jgi:penicillin-binding protein 1B